MSVQRVRVGDVLALQRRAVDVDPLAEYVEIGVRSFGKGIFHKEPLTGADLGAKRVFRIEPGDLVISNVFAWEGAVALATQAERGTIGSHRFMTFTPASDAIDSAWASWFFRSEPGLERIRKASPGSAGRNRTLAIERFENLVIPLPPIEEQRRVATHLDTIVATTDRVSSLSVDVAALSEALSRAVLGAAARRVRLGELVVPVSRPVALEATRPYRLIGCRWYGEGLFVRETKTGGEIAASRLFRVERGDLVYNRLFAWKASFALADESVEDGLVSGEFPTFRVQEDRIVPAVLAAALLAPDVLAQVDQRSSGSTPTSRNRLKESDFLDLEVGVPSRDRQAAVTRVLERTREIRTARARLRAVNEALRPSAMNQAFADLT